MGLRSKMMLIIFIFQVLVYGFITLLFALEETRRAQREVQRDGELLGRLITDWTLGAPLTTDGKVTWGHVEERLRNSRLLGDYAIVALVDGRPQILSSDSAESFAAVMRDAVLIRDVHDRERIQARGRTVFVPVLGPQREKYVARLELRAEAATLYGPALGGLVLAMSLGTVFVLLIIYVYINRIMLRPLVGLVEGAERVAAGDFSQKVPEATASDEVGTLVKSFNQMMDRMRQYQQSLQEEVRKAQQRIAQTERSLFHAQRLSTTGTLAAGIAHEINNPLGGMINAARMIRDGKVAPDRQREYLELVLEGLDRVKTIVQQVLQFRPSSFEPQPVMLRDVASRASAFVEHRARHKGVEVRNEVPESLPSVNGDPLELQQAFLNVLMNAVDACRQSEGMVTIYGTVEGETVRISVADNGAGMTDEQRQRCMDPFFTTKGVGEGTGLGLSVANSIIQNHGGRIDISSSPGRGTTISFILPSPKTLRTATPAEVPKP